MERKVLKYVDDELSWIFRAEMEEIKQEILSLSEKYSVKCVESAALEEQLAVVSKQLSQAEQHIQQLDARCWTCWYFV